MKPTLGVDIMFYTIVSDTLTSGKITFSNQPDTFCSITTEKCIQLNAGDRSLAVDINFENEQKHDVLKISSDVLKALSIPLNLPYQLVFSEKGLRIGPVIGLLMYNKRSAMTKKSLRRHLHYTLLYKNMGGLIYVFSLEDINFDTLNIKGHYYNPLKEKWEKGVFPFPDAIYRRVFKPTKIMQRIQKYFSHRMFNLSNFNKIDYWNMASSSKSVADHIPMTRKYSSFNDIDLMFENFNTLFLKPVNATKALGLIRVIKDKGKYSFQGKFDERPTLLFSKADAEKHFYKIKNKGTYIIQQAIDLLNFEDRRVDFRAIMQKDHTMDWQCTGIVTTMGKRGGICSNHYDDCKCMCFEEFLEKYLHLSKKRVFQKKNELIDVCKNACKILDENGLNCIDLGVDIGFDQNLKPWVFELNNRHHLHAMPIFINDHDMFFRVKINPIKYMVKLSGFNLV